MPGGSRYVAVGQHRQLYDSDEKIQIEVEGNVVDTGTEFSERHDVTMESQRINGLAPCRVEFVSILSAEPRRRVH